MNLRRLMIALLISAGLMLLLLSYVHNQQARRQAQQPAQENPPAAAAPTTGPATSASGQVTPGAASAPATAAASRPVAGSGPATAPTTAGAETKPESAMQWFTALAPGPGKFLLGSLEPNSGYVFQVELYSDGASVYTVKLADYFSTVEDKRLYDKNPSQYEQARHRDPNVYKGHYSLLNPVVEGNAQHLPLATQRLTLARENGQALGSWGLQNVPWKLSASDAQSATFEWKLMRGTTEQEARQHPFLRLVKTYTVRKNDYSFTVSLRVENLSGEPLKVGLDQLGPTGVPREDPRNDERQAAYGYYQPDSKKVVVTLKPNIEVQRMNPGPDGVLLGASNLSTPMLWVGPINKFFGSMLYVQPKDSDQLAYKGAKAVFYVGAAYESPSSKACLTSVQFPDILLTPGQKQEISLDVFAGPKKPDLFTNSQAPGFRELYQKLNFVNTIDFGSCTWVALSQAMLWLLNFFSRLAFGNYGVAIIVLVVLTRLVLHPLTKKGQVAMSKMQKMAPEMQKLREKYADDKEKLNKEMMRMSKEQGGTTLLGCLPMFLQMPIWIALYSALNADVDLRQAAFLPFWITDLAGPDAIIQWSHGFYVPMIGTVNSINPLPLLLAVAMYLQTKLTPQMTPTTTPESAKQQKIMAYMMPVMMLLFLYSAPSGLNLYIMTSTFAGVAEQYVIRKHIREKEVAKAAAETTVKVPGKGPRGSRPKKPKGPFWFKHG